MLEFTVYLMGMRVARSTLNGFFLSISLHITLQPFPPHFLLFSIFYCYSLFSLIWAGAFSLLTPTGHNTSTTVDSCLQVSDQRGEGWK